jgi:hypothetical protein
MGGEEGGQIRIIIMRRRNNRRNREGKGIEKNVKKVDERKYRQQNQILLIIIINATETK